MTPPAAVRPPLFGRRYNRRGQRVAGPPFHDPRTWKLLFSPAGLPGLALLVVFGLVLAVQTYVAGPEVWVLSGHALLAHGGWHAPVAHMFAHAGPVHLLLNATALLPLTALVMVRLGPGPDGWRRFALLYLGAGLAGAALFLAFNPTGPALIGSSGAIFGLWGAVSRIRADGGFAPLRSRQVGDEVFYFALLNALLYGIVFALVRLGDAGVGGMAWEAHLGGFLFGLLFMPWLAPRTPPPATV